jgi:biotin operon repressor
MDLQTEELLNQLRSLADKSRLSLLRALFLQEHSVGDLAKLLDLSEPTVSHHLARLREAGLVTLRTAGNQRFYRLNQTGMDHFKSMINEIEITPAPLQVPFSDDQWIEDLDWPEKDRQVLREFTSNGKLTQLPTKLSKMKVILRWLASLFQADRLYTESEVNLIIKDIYAEDYVGIRRDLIDMGYLRRERGGGRYWLAPLDNEKEKS